MKQDNSELNPAETSGNSPPITVAPEKHHYIAEGFKNRTKGEALFNIASYAGVGYFGVTAVSVGLTALLRHVAFFKVPFEKVANGFSRQFKISPDSANQFMTISAMFIGGSIMSVLPVKWLEDHKFKLVQWLDKRIYGEDRVAHDPQIRQAHREMEEVPEQTWKSVVAARCSSFIATFGTLWLIGANKSPLAKTFGHSIESVSIRGGRAIDAHFNAGKNEIIGKIEQAAKVSPTEPSGPHDRKQSLIWNYFVQDAIYTVITSLSLFSFTRVFAPLFSKPDASETLAPTIHAVPPAIPATAHPAHAANAPHPQIAQASVQGRVHENAIQLTQS